MNGEITLELHEFGEGAPDQARRLFALGMPGPGFWIMRSNAAMLGKRSAAFEDYHFTLWATAVESDIDLEDSPWYRLASSEISLTFQTWLQEARYGDSSVYGEVLWLPGAGRAINIRGLEHAKSKQDVDRAWGALQVLEHHPTLGRPPGTGQYRDVQEIRQKVDEAVAALVARAPLSIGEKEVAEQMGLNDERELRRLLRKAALNWKTIKPY